MKQTLSVHEVAGLLMKDKHNNGFSYEGCIALAEYFEEVETEINEEIEIDIVAIRCDWTEYDDFTKAFKDYNGYHPNSNSELDDDEKEKECEKYFQTRTFVIKFDKGVLIKQF